MRPIKTPATAILWVIFLAVAIRANVAIIYVKTDGNDGKSGLSWALAKAKVQAGLNTAVSGDEVWVKMGTYNQRITLKAGVGLYGGFVGTETTRNGRNWVMNVTILDGGQGGSVDTSPSGATSATVIDGFTIRNGKALYGGGIYRSSSSPTISNNTITNNTARGDSVAETGGDGGGMYCAASSAKVIRNNTVSNNMVEGWSGNYCYSIPFPPYQICNYASGGGCGGGLYCEGSNPTISGNTTASNQVSGLYGSPGGGGIACNQCTFTISGNLIGSNNHAWERGAGGVLDGMGPNTSVCLFKSVGR